MSMCRTGPRTFAEHTTGTWCNYHISNHMVVSLYLVETALHSVTLTKKNCIHSLHSSKQPHIAIHSHALHSPTSRTANERSGTDGSRWIVWIHRLGDVMNKNCSVEPFKVWHDFMIGTEEDTTFKYWARSRERIRASTRARISTARTASKEFYIFL